MEKIDFGYSCGLKGHVMYVTYYRQFYSSEVNTPQLKAKFNFLLKLAVNFSNWVETWTYIYKDEVSAE